MSDFSYSKSNNIHFVTMDASMEMVPLLRTKTEPFLDMVRREQAKDNYKVVVNGSFIGMSDAKKLALFVNPLSGAVPPKETRIDGFVIKDGKIIAGNTEKMKWYAAYKEIPRSNSISDFIFQKKYADPYYFGYGDPTPAKAAIGSLPPLIINDLPYGVENKYKAGVPANAPLIGPVPDIYKAFLIQRSASAYTSLARTGANSGKIVFGYMRKAKKIVLAVQASGENGLNIDALRDRLIDAGVNSAVAFDCSDSTLLMIDGKILVEPGHVKNQYIDVAVGFK